MAHAIATINEETNQIDIDPAFLPGSLRARAEELAAYLNERLGNVEMVTRQIQRQVERLATNWCERMRKNHSRVHLTPDGREVELDPHDFPTLTGEGLEALARALNFRFEKAANGRVSPVLLAQMQAFIDNWLHEFGGAFKKEVAE